MSAHEIVNEIRNLGARIQARGDRIHIDAPKGTIRPELKAKLSENKAEILKKLELEASMKRLEATHISIAVLDDGTMRVVRSDAEACQAVANRFAIYTPEDMYYYVQLEPHERRALHDFKKRFGGQTEWRKRE